MDVVQRLREAGHEALWAGGCVRDLLRGSEPSDYDVATSALPQQVRELFGRSHTHAVGMSFGVIIVRAPRRSISSVEVATFRTDASYSDGRRPDSVTFSTPQRDAQRRDFTINGMFYDPFSQEVIDYVGGQADLKARVIRAIGNPMDRFAEDKLRMLRAVRFAARFAFQIEPATRSAIAECAKDARIVSGERIATEVQYSLQTSHASWAVQEWFELGLLDVILPEVAQRWPETAHFARRLLDSMRMACWQSKLAGLLFACHGESAKDLVSGLQRRLKLSNTDAGRMRFALASQGVLESAHLHAWSQVQPVVAHKGFPAALELLDARCRLGLDPHCGDWIRHQIANTPELDPEPLLRGEDLMQMGLKPGPKFRVLLDLARQLQLDQRLIDRQAALDWARQQSTPDDEPS